MSSLHSLTINYLNSARLNFLDYIEEIRGYSTLTVRSYDDAISEALRSVSLEKNRIDLMPWRMKMRTLSRATVAKKLSAMRSFVAYLNKAEHQIVLVHDESIKALKRLPKPVAHAHIVEALQKATPMEHLVITLTYALGLRISELSGLRVDSFSSSWVRVMGKGKKERQLPIDASVFSMVLQFIEENNANVYLFEVNEKRLSENSLRYLINKAFKRIGLHVTPHQLRHSFATELLNGGARIADVSELLGHEHMATTQIYTKLGTVAKMQQYKLSHPLCHSVEDSHEA